MGIYEEILTDLEIWMNMPTAMSNVAAIMGAFFTGSWFFIILLGIIGFFVGGVIHFSFYSDPLRRIFPLFLGSWIISGLLGLLVGYMFISRGNIPAAIALGVVIIGNWVHIFDFLLLFLRPYMLSITISKKQDMGYTERLFKDICNKRAKKLDMQLNWGLYDEKMKNKH